MIAYILNLLDLGFTLHAIKHGAVELNPVMGCEPVMISYKLVIVGALCLWLSRRREPLARDGLHFLAAVYAAVNLWHIVNIAVRVAVK